MTLTTEDIYRRLEEKMLSYHEYEGVPVAGLSEQLVAVVDGLSLCTRQIDRSMLPYTGTDIYVREAVLKMLEDASLRLDEAYPAMKLEVVYGYRALQIQQQLFEQYRDILRDKLTDEQGLTDAVHRLIAVPDVAGHPTGGAVDVQIIEDGRPLDFGTRIWEFTEDSYTFSPFVSKTGWRSRQLLRRVMTAAGFAPFDGEWWHFSYGDKEWARYYDKTEALYDQVEFKVADTKTDDRVLVVR